MELPDLLRENGVDPEAFLERTREHWAHRESHWSWGVAELIPDYVIRAMEWDSQPEGWYFWVDLHGKWLEADSRDRWLALEAAMRMLDPLEAELLEVGDGVT